MLSDLLTRGEHLIRDGRFEEAMAVFRQLLEIDPEHLDARTHFARAALQAGYREDSLAAFLQALRRDALNEVLVEHIGRLVQEPALRKQADAFLEGLLATGPLGPMERRAALLLGHLLAHEGTYRAAYAGISITPTFDDTPGIALQGYNGLRLATECLSPLLLQALLIEDARGNKLLIITADLFGFGDALVATIREGLRPWGLPPEAILLNASHTHYAPGTVDGVAPEVGPYYEAYAQQIAQAVVGLMPQLTSSLAPCFLYAGCTEAQIGANRRLAAQGEIQMEVNSDGYYHRVTPVLVVDFLQTGRSVLLVNHGCHPTGLDREPVMGAAYPGHLRDQLTAYRAAGAVMFLQGAAGSAKPTVEIDGEQVFSTQPDHAAQSGQILAEAVVLLMEENLRVVRGPVFARIEPAALPLQDVCLDERYAAIEADDQQPLLYRHWARRWAAVPLADRPRALTVEVQLAGLGAETCFLSLPGEPVAGLARALLQKTSLPETSFFLGYTNGLKAYFPTAEMIVEGGYEADGAIAVYGLPTMFDPAIEPCLEEAVDTLLQYWQTPGEPNGYGRYHFIEEAGKAFFCLSTGRCGTQTLAHILNTARNARVYHHPQPYLVEETLAAYHGRIDLAATFWKARGGVIRDAWKDGRVFGELDHNMTPFTPALAEEIPAARFLVLVRNPWAFVRSGMRRGYYRGHAWDAGRLCPEPGHPDFDRWPQMTPFEKVCWLWNETYTRVERYLQAIDADRYRVVAFEDLTASPEAGPALFDFLGLEGFDEERVRGVFSQRLNEQTTGAFPPPEAWTPEQHQTLVRECRQQIQHLGYQNLQEQYLHQRAAMAPPRAAISAKKRVLFLEQKGLSTGGHLDHIFEYFREDYEARYLKTTDVQEAAAAIEWADMAWLEWASPLTAAVTRQVEALRHKPVVCRLHGFEVFSDTPAQIDWSVVDRLIFVARHKQHLFQQRFPKARVAHTVIRNGVNVDRFSIAPDKKNTKNLVLLGHINYRKGLPMLLQCYHALLARDSEYHLYIRGDWQDPRYQMAVMTMVEELRLHDHITFVEEWIDDLNGWLADKSHILSFSLEESFHYAVGNGMAAGLKPVVHAWRESRDIWPEASIFRTLDEFLALIEGPEYEPEQYRRWLFEHKRTMATQRAAVDQLVHELTGVHEGARPARLHTSWRLSLD